jgi:hypothetical protein
MNRLSKISHKSKLLLLGGLLVLMLLGYGVHLLETPAHGSAATVLPLKNNKNKIVVVVPAGHLDEKYFTLDTPAGYVVQSDNPAIPGVLASTMLTHASNAGTQIISVAISTAVDGGLQTNTGYAARMANPDRYHFETAVYDGEPVYIASDSMSSGAVCFWLHGSMVATIGVRSGFASAGGSSNTEEVKTIKTLLANWRWAQ